MALVGGSVYVASGSHRRDHRRGGARRGFGYHGRRHQRSDAYVDGRQEVQELRRSARRQHRFVGHHLGHGVRAAPHDGGQGAAISQGLQSGERRPVGAVVSGADRQSRRCGDDRRAAQFRSRRTRLQHHRPGGGHHSQLSVDRDLDAPFLGGKKPAGHGAFYESDGAGDALALR